MIVSQINLYSYPILKTQIDFVIAFITTAFFLSYSIIADWFHNSAFLLCLIILDGPFTEFGYN